MPVMRTAGEAQQVSGSRWKKGEVIAFVLLRARRTGKLVTGNQKILTLRHPK